MVCIQGGVASSECKALQLFASKVNGPVFHLDLNQASLDYMRLIRSVQIVEERIEMYAVKAMSQSSADL